jgi:hypothetical protein
VTDESTSAITPETIVRTDGKWLLFRKDGGGMRHAPRGAPVAGGPPRHRHRTFQSAAMEATRLLGAYPESTFLILQEVGLVKLKRIEEAAEAA